MHHPRFLHLLFVLLLVLVLDVLDAGTESCAVRGTDAGGRAAPDFLLLLLLVVVVVVVVIVVVDARN